MIKIRIDKDSNYKSIFINGKTIRQRINPMVEISTPKFAEIEDVSINNKCLANCSYCYTSALKNGINFDNILNKVDIWEREISNNRPFQIAIGGAGEPTMHPDFIEFVKKVESIGIVPNYTTNGMHLSDNILEATEKYCGGVALSFHPHIEKIFHKAMENLSKIKTKLNIHFILGEDGTTNKLFEIFNLYKDVIDYMVVLPYQVAGRAKDINTHSEWDKFFKILSDMEISNQCKFAFGALFYEWLKNNKPNININIYEPEIYSGYRIMDDSYETLRISSYNTNPK